jgi:hypothetical protein
MNAPGQDAAHAMQSTHRSRSIFLSDASTQFIGQTRSQMPQETQRALSSLNERSETDDAIPSVIPAGHQSQKRLPLKQEHNIITKNNMQAMINPHAVSPRSKSINDVIPRPKFEIGSSRKKNGGLALSSPTAANERTAAQRAAPTGIYFARDIFNLAEILHTNSCSAPIGQKAEQNTRPNIAARAKNKTTAPLVAPTPTARAENCQFIMSPNISTFAPNPR